MKAEVLVLYYTQSGQIKDIIESIVSQTHEAANYTFLPIKPVQDFPFPWPPDAFLDAMPETVLQQPIDIQPFPEEVFTKHFDFVILGYQPWYLHPSQPLTGFFNSPNAHILNGKNVITVLGARNMWLHGQEIVKQNLIRLNAQLVGHIALVDTHPNLVSLLTIMRWAFKGEKEKSGLLPAAGVQEKDIEKAATFGSIIIKHYQDQAYSTLQPALVKAGAVNVDPGLILLEKRGVKNFHKWATYIAAKGGPQAPERMGRLKIFKRTLLTAIFVLTPITGIIAAIQKQLKKASLKKEMEYFNSVEFEAGRL